MYYTKITYECIACMHKPAISHFHCTKYHTLSESHQTRSDCMSHSNVVYSRVCENVSKCTLVGGITLVGTNKYINSEMKRMLRLTMRLNLADLTSFLSMSLRRLRCTTFCGRSCCLGLLYIKFVYLGYAVLLT